MSDSGHPSRHGFVRCWWCGIWRRRSETIEAMVDGRAGEVMCQDTGWCWLQGGHACHGGKHFVPPVHPVVSETAPKPGWDANGTPIEQGEAL
jgi:hypothetical protein